MIRGKLPDARLTPSPHSGSRRGCVCVVTAFRRTTTGQAGPKRASLALARWARMGRWAACLPPAGAGALNRHGRASEQHERAEADHRHGRWEANLSGEGGALPRSGNSPRAPIIFPGVFFFEFVSWGMQPLQAKTLEVTCFQNISF